MSARFATEELGTLPAFATWGGDAADAARQAISKTRADLDAHGAEALAVAQAADQAADGIKDLKRRLNDLNSQANSLHMQINEVSNTVRPGPDFRGDAKRRRTPSAGCSPSSTRSSPRPTGSTMSWRLCRRSSPAVHHTSPGGNRCGGRPYA